MRWLGRGESREAKGRIELVRQGIRLSIRSGNRSSIRQQLQSFDAIVLRRMYLDCETYRLTCFRKFTCHLSLWCLTGSVGRQDSSRGDTSHDRSPLPSSTGPPGGLLKSDDGWPLPGMTGWPEDRRA
ncbi:hypothetical protein PISMIDRAFT_684051 [Pisolithus microcarpus 441]|uniref:Unplaced genomic scaffold scaffold_117, whole genome shotgun sequence n=1 Tax=Pisolithus microcarpus 441 TaxID=765257 RepID=A0A0C9YPQ6_9AGAM|nr:hypothetical protein BKA83DRAFT_684051 [Pisolithus microcarpus]KIK18601.1 hypothetical protein PISMIDRAFT_684051 [Pisolithus microcarpus 441]